MLNKRQMQSSCSYRKKDLFNYLKKKQMKFLILLLAAFGMESAKPHIATTDHFSFSEMRFINSVIRNNGDEKPEVFRLKNGKIAVNYSDQRLVLGQDGFIHDLEILEGNEWIDMGPEY